MIAALLTFFGGTFIWAFRIHPVREIHPFLFPSYEHRLPDDFSPVGWGPGDPPLQPPDQYTAYWRDIRFDTGALGWHLVYVSGLILVGVWVVTRMTDRGEAATPAPPRLLVRAGLPLLVVGGVAHDRRAPPQPIAPGRGRRRRG